MLKLYPKLCIKQNKEHDLKYLFRKKCFKALARVTAGNNSENFVNEIRPIVYSLYQSKRKTKKV